MASGNGNHDPSGLSPQAEVAARSFVQLLARELSAPAASTSSHMGRNQPPVRAVSTPVRAGDSAQPVTNNDRVRQAMRRQFPSVCQFTPKGSEELEHAYAGLGKRILSIPDNLIHSEIVALLEGEFPKLKTLKGGWMFYKATGGSGRRKLSIIPTESEGYSTRLLKSASNNGKNTMFIVPLQEQLSTEPLPYDSAEFAKMPQSSCITCGSQMPLQLLPLHVEGCNGTLIESECETPLDDSPIIEQPVSPTTWNGESSEVCPICLASFPICVLPSHASTCGDGMGIDLHSGAAGPTRGTTRTFSATPTISAIFFRSMGH
ncbi:unnamed protein product [Arctogadus glacialis]